MGPAAPVLSVISGIYGIYSGMQQRSAAKEAAKEQERMAQQNAANIEAETREEARRAGEAQDKRMAAARAQAAGSGVKREGSLDIFMGAEEDEFQRQLNWLLTSGKNRADLARRRGVVEGSLTRSRGDAAFGGAVGGGFKSIGGGLTDLNDIYQWW